MGEAPGGRVWLVTGASSGFGREIARAALRRGDRVAATARKTEALADLAAEAPEGVLAVRLDVTDPGGVRRAVEETTEEELRGIFDVHLFGPVALVRAVLPIMRRQRDPAPSSR